ncbi:diphosphoinositol polyphosphate phosphohydrolase 1 isoform X2 [Pseudophryne corroboree]|uniref:diphosphoinositol polyphosphate phosphohydrolase 1 isoform X2 n=1 Tax=Pseudophryne corroboree TaxID=495146 RepID=UPI0030820F06
MMKVKSGQTRTYDRDGYKKRAACVCFRSGAEDEVLLVSSSRYPDRWIVPGGGLEPEEEPSAAAVREVFEENFERKHRTFVYVLTVTEILEDWENSVSIGRKRRWFSIEEAIHALQGYKPVQASYFQSLKKNCHPNNGAIPLPSQSALPDVR